MNFEVPILLLGFNRPALFEKTLFRILQINPINLYISLDGPRLNNTDDIENCQKIKRELEQINKINELTKKNKEQEDYFDNDTNFTPFRVSL